MQFLRFNILFVIMILFLLGISRGSIRHVAGQGKISKKIMVDQGGRGEFTSVQQAIDSIPPNNNLWTLVYIKAATYNEKVIIPREKPFIILKGESMRNTIIQWNEAGSSTLSSTIIIKADNIMAQDIMFRNSYNLVLSRGPDGNRIEWAPAATLYGDKASFYRCGFAGVQDTLTDMLGRHCFKSCYIEGAIDFIWGRGQSVYEKCMIKAETKILMGAAGFITAQGRESQNNTSGFVFLDCVIQASGPVYLGRAYKQYSRVIYKRTYMPDAVVPEGWQPWNYSGHEETITFSETGCFGPGSNMAMRVKWEKTLPANELRKLTDVNSFLNADGWIQGQPAIR